MVSNIRFICVFCSILLLLNNALFSQQDRDFFSSIQDISKGFSGSSGNSNIDSLRKRDYKTEEVIAQYQKPYSLFYETFDTSLFIFSRDVLRIPETHIYLGNPGRPSESVVFQIDDRIGWRSGFNGFDPYIFGIRDLKFFNTHRPLTRLMYVYTPTFRKTEQYISIMHSQNIFPNFNFAGAFNLINSPGNFSNQNTNHSHFFFTAQYETTNRKSLTRIGLQGSRINSAENGGISVLEANGTNRPLTKEDLQDPTNRERYSFNSKLFGGGGNFNFTNFITDVTIGHVYKKNDFYFSQTIRIGDEELVCIDTNDLNIFYPKMSLEFNIERENYNYRYLDQFAGRNSGYVNDTIYSTVRNDTVFSANIINSDTLNINEQWSDQRHGLHFKYFFEKKNFHHFVKISFVNQNLVREVDRAGSTNFIGNYVNINYINHSIYRDEYIEFKNKYYLSGVFEGDMRISLFGKKRINDNLYINGKFYYIVQSPETLSDPISNFNLTQLSENSQLHNSQFQKTIINQYQLGIEFPKLNLEINGLFNQTKNFLAFDLVNYRQYEGVINIAQANLSFKRVLSRSLPILKKIMLRVDFSAQQVLQPSQATASHFINLPMFWTFSSISYYSKWGSKGKYALGIDAKYYSPFTTNNYSFLHAKFYPQNTTIYPVKPEIGLFLHFTLMRFTGFLRVDYLNTFSEFTPSAFTIRFLDNNFVLDGYPSQQQLLRMGIIWNISN